MQPVVYRHGTEALPLELQSLADPTADGSVYLTPDALLAYCQSRLQSIDSQAQEAFQGQQVLNQEQSLIAQAQQFLQSDANGTTSKSECIKIEQGIEDLINQIKAIDPHSPEIAKLEQLHDNIMGTGSGPYTDSAGKSHGYLTAGGPTTRKDEDSDISEGEMQGFINDLQGISSDFNSSAELQMIQLQSLMSQRQTAIQLTTNLVQSLGDQLNKIADNIGH